MSLLDFVRKGFGFLLMSFGISQPKKPIAQTSPKPKPAARPGE